MILTDELGPRSRQTDYYYDGSNPAWLRFLRAAVDSGCYTVDSALVAEGFLADQWLYLKCAPYTTSDNAV